MILTDLRIEAEIVCCFMELYTVSLSPLNLAPVKFKYIMLVQTVVFRRLDTEDENV